MKNRPIARIPASPAAHSPPPTCAWTLNWPTVYSPSSLGWISFTVFDKAAFGVRSVTLRSVQ